MSIRAKTEGAFRQLLIDAAVAGVEGKPQILRSHENQYTVKDGLHRVNIRAVAGNQVTPKSRNLRMMVFICVESGADKQEGQADNPEDLHASFVDDIHEALDDNATPLATRLSNTRS